MMKITLSKLEKREIKEGRAQILVCAKCGKEVYYDGMGLISLSIRNKKPSCSYECSKQV